MEIPSFTFPQLFCALRDEVKCFELVRKTVRSPRIRNENKTNKHKSQKLAAFYQLIERKIQQAALSLKIATTGLQFLGFVEFRGPGS